MLERLRALGQQRREATPTGEPFPGAPTTVEPLPPPDALVDDEHRPTIKEIPVEMRNLVRGTADRVANGAARESDKIADGVTSKLQRVPPESTPAPLPPSPEAEQAAASWFESVPTSPAASPAHDAFRPGIDSSVRSLITPVRDRDGAKLGTPPTAAYARPRLAGAHAHTERPWLIPALIAATALVVGMVLGALIFGGSAATSPADRDAGVCAPCPDCTAGGDDSAPGR